MIDEFYTIFKSEWVYYNGFDDKKHRVRRKTNLCTAIYGKDKAIEMCKKFRDCLRGSNYNYNFGDRIYISKIKHYKKLNKNEEPRIFIDNMKGDFHD